MAKKKRAGNNHQYVLREPEVEGWDKLSEDERVAKMANWPQVYKEVFSKKQLQGFFYEWVKRELDESMQAPLKAAKPMLNSLHGSYARAINQGYVTDYYQIHLMEKVIPKLIDYGNDALAEQAKSIKPKPTSNKPSIQDRISEQTRWIIGDFEGEVDDFLEAGCKKVTFEPLKYLRNKDVKGPHTGKIRTFYEAVLAEINELLDGKDDQLNEGYAFLSRSQQKKYRKFIKGILVACEDHIAARKMTRKPRKRKVKTALQKVAGVKYKEKDEDFNISSVSPSKMEDAEQVWIFNTKDRFLYRYVSSRGMTVKGTTLYDFDETLSFKKKIRKPEKILPSVLKDGKVKLRKLMDGINAKEAKVTGRIGPDMVILRVV